MTFRIPLLICLPLLLAGCNNNSKTEQFASADGSLTATRHAATNQWTITDSVGREPVEGYDSMRVVEAAEDGRPITVVYYKGREQHIRQYFSTMHLRSEGMSVDGKREGRWVFYHPTGAIQVEATYVDGKEEGPYRVYRADGAPYYIGQYEHGVPTGQWEVYDPEGNLVERTEY